MQRKGAAIGALHDVDDLTHGGDFKPQHVVDEDRAVHVRLGKSIGRRVEFGMIPLIAHAQRIKVRRQMAPDTVGADQHQRADAVKDRLLDLVVGQADALFLRLGLDLVACGPGLDRFGPDTCQRAHHIARWGGGPIAPRP